MLLKCNRRKLAETLLSRSPLLWILLLWTLLPGASTATGAAAQAQSAVPATHVSDTIHNADGTAASGTVLIGWPAFTTAGGTSIQAGSTAVTLGAGGSLSVQLAPNAGSTPMGSYYTAVYHLASGAVTREYWVVPATASPVALSAIKSTALPASVAMQTVSRSYVDTAIAAAVGGHPLDSPTQPYVLKTGDTMTGALVLPGDPTSPTQAADKQYVDEQTAALTSGFAQKVSLSPSGSQTVAQPPGTQLAVNSLNGAQYASQFAGGAGNNGIANAAASAACAGGCDIVAGQTYPQTEVVNPVTLPSQTHIDDRRGGAVTETFVNPEPLLAGGFNSAHTINLTSTQSTPALAAAEQSSVITSDGLAITSNALAGGSNTLPDSIQGAAPYFKTTYGAMSLTGNNNTVGQHNLVTQAQNCYGVGDCLMGGLFLKASGGFRDDADEGAHPYDYNIAEDTAVFSGSCSQGCSAGSTSVLVGSIANAGTQGEGRYLVDTNPAKAITAGSIIGGNPFGATPSVSFSGTNFPLSVLLETAATIPSQANNISPGTVTAAIVTSGPPTGYATNTAALPATSGIACVIDPAAPDGRALNFETAAYTVVDGSHLQLTLIRPHSSGATVSVGGLCGYGLEQKVDTVNGIRQIFPVVGSTSPTSLLYSGGLTSIVGTQGFTSAYANVNVVIASVARTAGLVTLTSATVFPDLSGLTVTISGVTDSSYNGSFTVTTTGNYTLTYPSAGPDSSSTGGTLSLVTGSYGLYPMAESVSVYNPTTGLVDGLITLAANNVAWAAGDPVEMPHYFQEKVFADVETVVQYTPRPLRDVAAGVEYDGNNGPGLTGWLITNGSPVSNYFGNGGTHTPPLVGLGVAGVWHHAIELQAGEDAAIETHCNSHGCDKWNSAYDLFQMDTSVGVDRMHYSPQTSTLNFSLRGTQYQMDPNGLTANTINVTTLNAGTVRGLFTGTVGPSSLPIFGASGIMHQVGAVPDPGTTAGTTRFLREDGSWSVPAGTGAGTGAGIGVIYQTQLAQGAGVYATDIYSALGITGPRNLFNPASAWTNCNDIGAAGGTLVAQGCYVAATDYIPVAGLTSFVSNYDMIATGGDAVAFYDEGRNFLSSFTNGGVRIPAGTAVTIPPGSVYMRTSLVGTNSRPFPNDAGIYTGTTLPGSFIGYGYVYPDKAYVAGLKSAIPTPAAYPAAQWAQAQTLASAQLPLVRNLFDVNRVVNVSEAYSNVTLGIRPWGLNFIVWSGLIPIVPGQQYTLAGMPSPNNSTEYGLAFFDLSGAPIASSQIPTASMTQNMVLTAPSNAGYLGFPINTAYLNAVMLLPGTPTPPALYIPFASNPSTTQTRSPWQGKVMSIFGDSYCYANVWQQQIAAYHGMTIKLQDCRVGRPIGQIFECYGNVATGTNQGTTPVANPAGGTTTCGGTGINNGTAGNTLAQDLAGSDLILIELGTNDNYDPALGTVADTPGTASTYGYTQAAIQGLLSVIPATTRVVWLGPIQVSSTAGNRAAMMAPVSTAVQTVVGQYGVPFVDNIRNSGFNLFSDTALLQSDGIHPTIPAGFTLYGRYPTLRLNEIPPMN